MVDDHWVFPMNQMRFIAPLLQCCLQLLGPTVSILNPFEKTFCKDIVSTYFIISCEKDNMLYV